ncbi:MAG: hypothetical protein HY543_07900 [Deltaproteobacteria bacterium]|nr:hypothetical protein [Deltaproteobacteria bacterium]
MTDTNGRRLPLITAVVHEFLHHVAHKLYEAHRLPEAFFEPFSDPITNQYLPNKPDQQTPEHLWIYQATEVMPGLVCEQVDCDAM